MHAILGDTTQEFFDMVIPTTLATLTVPLGFHELFLASLFTFTSEAFGALPGCPARLEQQF